MFPNILFSTKEKNVAYHVTLSVNRASISEQGLVPFSHSCPKVINASRLIDANKSKRIPPWLSRLNAVYAHIKFSNEMLFNKQHKDHDLWAAQIIPEKCWVGSQGLGGFCMYLDEDFPSSDEKESFLRDRNQYARAYWDAACSLLRYRAYDKKVRRSDDYWGLDELLISYSVPPTEIVLLGSWSADGVFSPTNEFINYVKNQYNKSWEEIAAQYLSQ